MFSMTTQAKEDIQRWKHEIAQARNSIRLLTMKIVELRERPMIARDPIQVLTFRSKISEYRSIIRSRERAIADAKKAGEQIIAETLHAKVGGIDLSSVSVMSKDRHIPLKEQAAKTRELFKTLGLKGISVTTPNYSMASSVEVELPKRSDFTVFKDGGFVDRPNDPACLANTAAEKKVEAILAKAFPNHDDRSDIQTDYFDYCWSVR